jgi:rSAM/selenodomain-associated transferase 1
VSRSFLIVFVKEPRPGHVKTRLARDLGPELAARVYRALAEAEIAATRPEGAEYERLFFHDPQGDVRALRAWLPGESLLPQAGADLGERMRAAFEQCFAAGARRVAIVGTDVPWAGRSHVLAALAVLEFHDAAVGPTPDGGYYLLALRAPQPGLFEGVPWSTPDVLATTRVRARELGLSLAELEPLPDVDTLDDLRREWHHLQPLLAGHPRLLDDLGPFVG